MGGGSFLLPEGEGHKGTVGARAGEGRWVVKWASATSRRGGALTARPACTREQLVITVAKKLRDRDAKNKAARQKKAEDQVKKQQSRKVSKRVSRIASRVDQTLNRLEVQTKRTVSFAFERRHSQVLQCERTGPWRQPSRDRKKS